MNAGRAANDNEPILLARQGIPAERATPHAAAAGRLLRQAGWELEYFSTVPPGSWTGCASATARTSWSCASPWRWRGSLPPSTLALAGATFVSVQASARSTRIAERALLAGQRPVLAPAGPDDPADSVQFADGRVFPLRTGGPHEVAGVPPARRVSAGAEQRGSRACLGDAERRDRRADEQPGGTGQFHGADTVAPGDRAYKKVYLLYARNDHPAGQRGAR